MEYQKSLDNNWKADYIRMWQEYFGKIMSPSEVDDVINKPYQQDLYLKSYKFGRMLEALGKLKFPN